MTGCRRRFDTRTSLRSHNRIVTRDAEPRRRKASNHLTRAAPLLACPGRRLCMTTNVMDKRADLAGPGIGDYTDLEKILPADYHSLLTPRETQQAITAVKRYIEDFLCKELNLMMVEVPLIVDVESGVNDMLDRDGSRTPIQFHISNDHDEHPVDAQMVQAATKWKRAALKQFDCKVGAGICTDMRAVRKDYFLDHDHSAYVDQWDWERVITAEQRNLEFLKTIVGKIWKVIVGAE